MTWSGANDVNVIPYLTTCQLPVYALIICHCRLVHMRREEALELELEKVAEAELKTSALTVAAIIAFIPSSD